MLDAGAWKPGHLRKLVDGVVHVDRPVQDDETHLRAAADWLCRAQDATPDGGVCGRYSLRSGWSSSYPETTGYIVPTFLALAKAYPDADFEARARRCVDFLLAIQLSTGAFPGMEIHENSTEPSFFNTAQILHGLVAWHRHAGGEEVAHAARRAADWLCEVQDEDGAYTRYTYGSTIYTYSAHASCWLAEAGQHFGKSRHLSAANRHLDWVLGFYDRETGFIDCMGFDEAAHRERRSVTHTIAYTIWGMLFTAQALGRDDGVTVAGRAAERVMRRLELSRFLPGELDHRWRGVADYECLTGNAQMALIWFRLYQAESDARWLSAACLALDGVKAAQSLNNRDDGVRGGVSGSVPVWGDYIRMCLPNWAAKFFIDALLEKRVVLDSLGSRPRGQVELRPDLPRIVAMSTVSTGTKPRVVVYTRPAASKLGEMLEAWRDWGFLPDAVVLEEPAEPPALDRLWNRVRQDGIAPLLARVGLGGREQPAATGNPHPNADALCRKLGLRVVRTGALTLPDSVDAVRALSPDVAVYAGAGILRAPLLEVPRLGTLNAHMGILPHYRGMNVAEWACFNGDAVGCTVHLITPGIDEGDILCAREVDVTESRSLAEVRRAVDKAQLALLGEVLQAIIVTGELPAYVSQTQEEGRQFFRMHEALRAVIERELGVRRSFLDHDDR
jgi:hypothetical protein